MKKLAPMKMRTVLSLLTPSISSLPLRRLKKRFPRRRFCENNGFTLCLLIAFGSVVTPFLSAQTTAFVPTQLQQVDPNGPARFAVVGDRIYMKGSIIPSQGLMRSFQAALQTGRAKTLVLLEVPGSTDDDAALPFFRKVRQLGLNTHVPSNGYAASGGVDLFCAGVKRTVDPGGKLLVHPWEDSQLGSGANVPLSNPIHQPYFTYYKQMQIPASFYLLTLNAPLSTVQIAPGVFMPEMHLVTPAELIQHGLVTGKGSPAAIPAGNSTMPKPVTQRVVSGNKMFATLPGTWNTNIQGIRVIQISGNGRFEANGDNGNQSGQISQNGSNLIFNFFQSQPNVQARAPFTISFVKSDQNQFQFGNNVLFTRVRQVPNQTNLRPKAPMLAVPKVQAEVGLNGNWTELDRDGKAVKMIVIAGGQYTERVGNQVDRGTIRVVGNLMTLTFSDGEVEQFGFSRAGNNRINFIDPQTQRPISSFFWVRQ